MNDYSRREWLRAASLLVGAALVPTPVANAADWFPAPVPNPGLRRSQFGPGFVWGSATSAYQVEGAWNVDGKGESVWDRFAHTPGKIKDGTNGDVACDFYNRYRSDIALMRGMNLPTARFSVAWSRVLPEGVGQINTPGLDFYKRLADECMQNNIVPWLTLYHWDLPQVLEDRGGWANRDVLRWFEEYVNVVTRALADRVQNWMVFNEPAAFVSLGYLIGLHAPGRRSLGKYLAATHHVNLCHGIGGRVVRANVPNANVGSTFSCSAIHPQDPRNPRHKRAAQRLDATLNRLFLEPSLGLGYPWGDDGFPALRRIEKHMKPDDEKHLPYAFDFHGLQNYFRVVAKPSLWPPLVWAKEVPPAKRGPGVELTDMGWEVYPEGIYEMLKYFARYEGIRNIIVTENGAAFPDVLEGESIRDAQRTEFLQRYLAEVLRAKSEGVPVNGYMVWSFMDNFEWAEGFRPRFGLVHVDYPTQQRRLKDSGRWFQGFLADG